jgi:hypothetical protein
MYWANANGNLVLQAPTFTTAMMTGSFSFAVWANLAAVNRGAADNVWLSYGAAVKDEGLQLTEVAGHPHVGFYSDDTNCTTVTLSANVWFHLVFVKDGNVLTVYYNGINSCTYTTGSALTVSWKSGQEKCGFTDTLRFA